MSKTLLYTLSGGGAFVLCVVLVPLVTMLARRWDLVDKPDARKVHTRPIPRVGGVAIASSMLIVSSLAVLAHHIWFASDSGHWVPREMVVLLAVGLVVFAVGLVDDIRSIPAKYKLLALVAGGAALCGVGVQMDALYTQHTLYLALGLAAWPVTIFWLTGMTTAVNFIDGLDGLAAGLVAFAAGILSVLLIAADEPGVAVISIALAASLLAFLIYNSHPAKVFMGDGGSMFIGFMLAACCVLAAPRIGTMKAMVVPAAALSVPILDTALTMFRRRVIERRSIFSAERGHIHHRLLDIGLSQRHAVFLIYGVSVLACAIAWMSLWAKGWGAFGVLALLVPLLLGFFRAAGSIRSRDIIGGFRRKRMADREQNHDRRLFEDMQLRFRRVTTFSEWWQVVCQTAETMDFLSVDLPLVDRDGKERALQWRSTDDRHEGVEVLSATVPVRERRRDGMPLRAQVSIIATTSLERAGHRLALFSRLMNEHSVAELPITSNGNSHGGSNGHVAGTPPTILSKIVGWNRIAPVPAQRCLPRSPAPETSKSVVQDLRVAIVHDFLYTYAGAERVLEQMVQMYPHADLFSLFDFLPEKDRHFIANKPVTTTFLQHMPFARTRHRAYLPLMPLAVEQLDLSGYDLVISSSYLAAKSVITGPDQLHICYCHSPIRSAWDLQHQYLNEGGIGFGPRGMIARAILHYIRNWDARSALGVDAFVANSQFVARRIRKVYRRDAAVIYPPVDTEQFTLETKKKDFFVTASRLVSYKRMDLLVEAFNRMPDRELKVVGEGPEFDRLREMAGPNVELLGHLDPEQLRRYMQQARGFVFAAEEDFGIVPVEAMACGTPVIAYGQGGVTESVVDGETGVFFDQQTPESVMEAIERFEEREAAWDADAIRRRAEMFAREPFRAHFGRFVEERWCHFANSHNLSAKAYAAQVASSATTTGYVNKHGEPALVTSDASSELGTVIDDKPRVAPAGSH